MERMSVTLSIWSASMGMTSLTSMPGTLVLIGLKSPRTLEGALGLGSQISMWLGPPCRNSMITDLAAPKALPFDSTLAAADAFQERNSGRFNPNKPAPPTRINSRRDQPSQVRTGRPGIVSMYRLLGQDYTTWLAPEDVGFQISDFGGSASDLQSCNQATNSPEIRHPK